MSNQLCASASLTTVGINKISRDWTPTVIKESKIIWQRGYIKIKIRRLRITMTKSKKLLHWIMRRSRSLLIWTSILKLRDLGPGTTKKCSSNLRKHLIALSWASRLITFIRRRRVISTIQEKKMNQIRNSPLWKSRRPAYSNLLRNPLTGQKETWESIKTLLHNRRNLMAHPVEADRVPKCARD